jgi:hypothetical protein
MDLTYWASRPSDEIADEIIEKVRQYYLFLFQSGRLELYQNAFQMYYGPALQGAAVTFTGQTGELVSITVNDFRNLLKHLHTLVTTQRPAFECRATNTDHKSQAQTILGQGLLDYYLREKKLEVYQRNAVELALIYAEAFISVTWNSTMGEPYATDPETGKIQNAGDIEYRYFSPLDMARDPVQRDPYHAVWGCPIVWKNKWDLAAKYPEYSDKIAKLTPDFNFFAEGADNLLWNARALMWGDFIADEIPTFEFYHAKTDALPEGRAVICLADGTTLFDGPLPYTEVPVYRIACGEFLGTPFGYTTAFDLMPVQEMSDSVHSTICTNQSSFGVQNIWAKKGMGIEVSTIAGGMRLFESDEKPEPLQLTATSPETFKYGEVLHGIQSRLSGINEVAQGNPQRDMSGSMAALLQSMAVQYSMDLQMSFARMFEDTGSATLDRLKTFAKVPRIAAITGKSNQQYMKEFTADDINLLNRVLVEVGNPMMNTMAGKAQLAEMMLNSGLITTPEQYIMVLTTGKVEPLYENLQSELMLIRAENELISEGKIPPVLLTDNPLIHIKEHAVIANSPDSRNDPGVMQAYTQHIQTHIDLWRTMDPDLANMLGIPLPPPIMPMGMPPAMPAENGQQNAMPGDNKPKPQQSLSPMPPAQQKAQKITMPNPAQPPAGTPMQNQGGVQ